jgi:hypothetical protein
MDWELWQQVARRVYNRQVDREFRDLPIENAEAIDLTIPRHALYFACRLRDEDSAIMTACKMQLFYFALRKAQDLQTPVYGIPVPSYQEARKFKPQIELYFQEDPSDVESGFSPVTGRISFRLMNEESETLVASEARTYARRIETEFGRANGFVWRKGRNQVTYTDPRRGYALRILCTTRAEGKRVVEQVLDIQGHSPNWEYLNYSENDQPSSAHPAIPPRRRVYGEQRRMPRSRPVAQVRFRYALLHIHGMPNPVVLVDRANIFRAQPLAR